MITFMHLKITTPILWRQLKNPMGVTFWLRIARRWMGLVKIKTIVMYLIKSGFTIRFFTIFDSQAFFNFWDSKNSK